MSVIHSLLRLAEDLDEDEEMVSPSQIAMQLVDWTDPRRLVDLSKTMTNDLETIEEETTSTRNMSIHVELAISIMTQMKKGSSTSFGLKCADTLEQRRNVRFCAVCWGNYILLRRQRRIN